MHMGHRHTCRERPTHEINVLKELLLVHAPVLQRGQEELCELQDSRAITRRNPVSTAKPNENKAVVVRQPSTPVFSTLQILTV